MLNSSIGLAVRQFAKTGLQNFPGKLETPPEGKSESSYRDLKHLLEIELPGLDNHITDQEHSHGEILRVLPDGCEEISYQGTPESGSAVRIVHSESEPSYQAYRFQEGSVESLVLSSSKENDWKPSLKVARFSESGLEQSANIDQLDWLLR